MYFVHVRTMKSGVIVELFAIVVISVSRVVVLHKDVMQARKSFPLLFGRISPISAHHLLRLLASF
jgi:hypothetical protein